jgi:hypothetical protein
VSGLVIGSLDILTANAFMLAVLTGAAWMDVFSHWACIKNGGDQLELINFLISKVRTAMVSSW